MSSYFPVLPDTSLEKFEDDLVFEKYQSVKDLFPKDRRKLIDDLIECHAQIKASKKRNLKFEFNVN